MARALGAGIILVAALGACRPAATGSPAAGASPTAPPVATTTPSAAAITRRPPSVSPTPATVATAAGAALGEAPAAGAQRAMRPLATTQLTRPPRPTAAPTSMPTAPTETPPATGTPPPLKPTERPTRPPPTPAPPAAPSALRIELIADGGILVFRWIDNSDNEDGFDLRYALDAGPFVAVTEPMVTANQTSAPAARTFPCGIAVGPHRVEATIRAVNRAGSSDSSAASLDFAVAECATASPVPTLVTDQGAAPSSRRP
jgi:hypothetical protein